MLSKERADEIREKAGLCGSGETSRRDDVCESIPEESCRGTRYGQTRLMFYTVSHAFEMFSTMMNNAGGFAQANRKTNKARLLHCNQRCDASMTACQDTGLAAVRWTPQR